MAAGKYPSEHRNRVHEVLLGITVGLGSNLLRLPPGTAVHSPAEPGTVWAGPPGPAHTVPPDR
ncbi:hypothetical protein GCM10009802_31890 [Streptomyces synnematoformans]|uniref:Uncharacterized protein n=1 Tax=Streptomyces synnematoformans TaxID=415721 RepID=A0ABN2YEX7_9ACTN